MKSFITTIIWFIAGAAVMYLATPKQQPPPAADLIVWTSNKTIYVPITKEKALEFQGPMQINGMSVKGREPH